jgi:hypothetical protein
VKADAPDATDSTDVKADSTDVKADVKADAKADVKAGAKADVKADAKADAKADVRDNSYDKVADADCPKEKTVKDMTTMAMVQEIAWRIKQGKVTIPQLDAIKNLAKFVEEFENKPILPKA